MSDPDAFQILLPLSTADAAFGGAVREALRSSRTEMPQEVVEARGAPGAYRENLARAFGLASTRNIYSGMRSMFVQWVKGQIVFNPTRRRRGGVWEGFPRGLNHGHEDIVIPFESTDAELGAAIRICHARCL